jgi:predicted nucleotidyltransferase
MQENRDVLKKIGVEINDEKIAIDLKKTKSFFTMLQELLQQKAQDLQKNLEEGKLEIEDVGVRVDDEHVEIDLAKTKSFLETFGKETENFLSEIEKAARQIEKK